MNDVLQIVSEKRFHQKGFPQGLESQWKKRKIFLKTKINEKQVRTITGGLLKKKEILRDKEEERDHNYSDVVSTGKPSYYRYK